MNPILKEIKKIIDESIAQHLPNIKAANLEKNGAVFYMNGNNGTEFDWYVNEKLPSFMVFYNNKDNLGAAKLLLYSDGGIDLYIYGENGKKLVKEISCTSSYDKSDIFKLAVMLKKEADDMELFDADIAIAAGDSNVCDSTIAEFKSHEKYYDKARNRKNILSCYAYVSKMITQDVYKVGCMERFQPHDTDDSGWFFACGTEDENYMNDTKNLELIPVGMLWQQFDMDIFPYIDMPIGSRLIRISEDEFEEDKYQKEIYTAKR